MAGVARHTPRWYSADSSLSNRRPTDQPSSTRVMTAHHQHMILVRQTVSKGSARNRGPLLDRSNGSAPASALDHDRSDALPPPAPSQVLDLDRCLKPAPSAVGAIILHRHGHPHRPQIPGPQALMTVGTRADTVCQQGRHIQQSPDRPHRPHNVVGCPGRGHPTGSRTTAVLAGRTGVAAGNDRPS